MQENQFLILYTIVSQKMAQTNSAEADQTAPSGFTLFAIPLVLTLVMLNKLRCHALF